MPVAQLAALRPYVCAVESSDGVRSEVGPQPCPRGEVFTPFKDPAFFAQAFLDGESVAWPSGADFTGVPARPGDSPREHPCLTPIPSPRPDIPSSTTLSAFHRLDTCCCPPHNASGCNSNTWH